MTDFIAGFLVALFLVGGLTLALMRRAIKRAAMSLLPELRPGAEVTFRHSSGAPTTFVVRAWTTSLNEPTVVELQDAFSVHMQSSKRVVFDMNWGDRP